MKRIFVDTNFFIQCQTPNNVKWNDVFTHQDCLQILIPRAVQVEIDRLKQDGNNRRSKRARSANSLIRKIILENENKLVINQIDPFIELTFPPQSNSSLDSPNFLDTSRVDDQIIAEILLFKNDFPNEDVYLLTHDTNPLLTAKRCGIKYLVIPDSWLLPPESDSKDKKIAALERYVEELRKSIPDIKITTEDTSGNEITNSYENVSLFKNLSDLEIEKIVSKFKNQFPLVTNFSEKPPKTVSSDLFNHFTSDIASIALGMQKRYLPPTEKEIKRYKTEIYPTWIANISEYISSLPTLFEEETRSFLLTFATNNSGNVSAENVIVEFKAHGDILFSRKREEDKDTAKDLLLAFPEAPIPPKGKWKTIHQSAFSSFEALNAQKVFPFENDMLGRNLNLFQDTARDRNSFYYKTSKYGPPTKSIMLECEEFRHKIDTENFFLTVLIPPSIQNKCNCAIECIVSAKNLPEPVRYMISINIDVTEKDSIVEVEKFLLTNNFIKK